jgi:transposase-like protein
MLDAAYFKKSKKTAEAKKKKTRETCSIVLMDYRSKKPIYWEFVKSENYGATLLILKRLKDRGLNPLSFTTDGLPSTIRAIREVYPNVLVQRCLIHIVRQSLSWLRTNPKSEAGKELRGIVRTIGEIKSEEERNTFVDRYFEWHNEHREFIEACCKESIASKDLKRTATLLTNALSNAFHYLSDRSIPKTTNALEGFFGRLKDHYRRHRGLSKKHIVSYLNWFCYFKSI